jgi:predicted DCC family thiol-disulfide oxidoreductase YuxK
VADPSGRTSQACLLIYDGHCRLCVTAKKGLERLETHADASPIRMVPYQSEEAKLALGESYRPGRPNAAFLSVLTGRLPMGLMPFWPSCQASRGGGRSQSF